MVSIDTLYDIANDKAVERGYNQPWGMVARYAHLISTFMCTDRRQEAVQEANRLLGGYGVESVSTRKGTFLYVNMGDCWKRTVIVPVGGRRKRLFIGCTADLV